MHGASISLSRRLARLAWPHRNRLARGSDRVESASLVLVVIVILLLGPVMLMFGSIVHADMAAAGEQQMRTRQPAVAVLARDAPYVGADGPGGAMVGKANVPATWTLPDGTTGSGQVRVDDELQAGAKVDIWVDQDGRVVDRPYTAADAAVSGAMVTLAGWLGSAVLLVVAQTVLHILLNRHRYRVWDWQWAHVEPGWNKGRQ